MASDIIIRRTDLKDIQLQIRELAKDTTRELQRLDRRISGLLGETKPRPRPEKIESRTGIKSRCAEIRKSIEPIV
jgi:hypothetical protein